MRFTHWEALRPICPACRQAGGQGSPLKIGSIQSQTDEHVLFGILNCTSQSCQREYPIIDGVPLLVAPIRDYVMQHKTALLGRADLDETAESWLGDCLGPDSDFDHIRQHQSSYIWDHYAEFDPAEARPNESGSIARLLARLLKGADLGAGPRLELGCGAGRATFELAAGSAEFTLGVDLNFALLKSAKRILLDGRVSYPRRRVGLVYERREFETPFRGAANVDFWACDATALPFDAGQFAATAALHILDSVSSPVGLLQSIEQTLNDGGHALLACPYDWSPSVTPMEAWIGGHSQRSPRRGDGPATLREALRPAARLLTRNWQILREYEAIPWQVRRHDRSRTEYEVHGLVARVTDSVA